MKKLSLFLGLIIFALLLNSCGKDETVVTPPSDPNFYTGSLTLGPTNANGTIVTAKYLGAKKNKITVEFTGETDVTDSSQAIFYVTAIAADDTSGITPVPPFYSTNSPVKFVGEHTLANIDVSALSKLGLIFKIELIRSVNGVAKYVKLANIKVRES